MVLYGEALRFFRRFAQERSCCTLIYTFILRELRKALKATRTRNRNAHTLLES
jgi:hypothetical protein